jgi:heme/copper-type cytochrome/quinol oxidase subunit 2
MVSTKVGGKNVFIPSTVVMTAGEGRSLSFFNTTDIPHGFMIPSLGVETVLPSKEEFVVELPKLEPGVYALQCHLHPPHRGATLLVLPKRK